MSSVADSHGSSGFRALIAGGGIAGLEAALALREMLGPTASVTVLEPSETFRLRPLTVVEPFGGTTAPSYAMEDIALAAGFDWRPERLGSVDAGRRVVLNEAGEEIAYDALLLALGARRSIRYRHALTLEDDRLDEQLHGLVRDVEDGYVHSIVFLASSRTAWPLPLYELALMTARRAFEMGIELPVTIVTAEERPLGIFGQEASREVARRLDAAGILTITGSHCEIDHAGHLRLSPRGRELKVDRVVALPELSGRHIPGAPSTGEAGFLPVDPRCRVRGLERVWAAGDGTVYPVRQGGIAAQQAETAAAGIAALAGAHAEPQPLQPVLRGVLLGDALPLYLSARIIGGQGYDSKFGTEPQGNGPSGKVAAPRLTAHLERLGAVA